MIYQLRLLLKQTLILRLSNVSSLFYLQFVQCLRKTNQHLRGLVLVLWTACASSGAVRWWFFLCWPVGAGVINGGCWWLSFAVSDALVTDGTKITEKSLDLNWAMTAIRLTSGKELRARMGPSVTYLVQKARLTLILMFYRARALPCSLEDRNESAEGKSHDCHPPGRFIYVVRASQALRD